ncbi:S8 family peptidase [Actinophytocola sp.]|uniref:S8 family peptidase n=1 Tax=Actinophytocola sp. TaxID=1872138 RepID=UPI002D5274CD|nr:S8 family serine peptidase [Actinophytocola sp.]HYQ63809.1 S8 family serine peptidase [Actinophytocola sp.]
MRTRRLVGPVVITAVVGSVLSAPATQAAPPASSAEHGTVYSVTLVTGDRVTVAHTSRTWEIRGVEPARRLGHSGDFLQYAGPSGVTVIPRDAVPLLRDGRLDDALFDVEGLIRQGYDDAHTKNVPLLVQSTDRRAVTALGAVTRDLPGARLTAVNVPKPAEPAATDVLDTARSGTKIWLNGKAFPTLDQSVPQIGAPDAWAAGQTGAGATIAILDSGYDPDHPDLAGVVTGEHDFIGTPSGIRDEVGHGTHVASIAAGRGTASGGRFTGVAKGAHLVIGKVCDVGGCPYDAILAGMQWAAESGVRVVNMSLGGGPGDGTDPIETELNRLSARYGTLFVVAAGNDGEFDSPVSTPASADAALAVASVSKQDVLSPFSSRGPRYGDSALKPDIAAPGESIVAARAAGTLPEYAVDDHYARLDGTSMATPHVAGAAAILAAQHPDWSGEQLKSALMSTAHPIDAGVYEAGAGRVDVARAVRQPVTANPASLSLGYVRWPHDGPAPEPETVTYRNTGAAGVMLDLALTAWNEDGQPAPEGMFRADRSSVTVPAGGTATVTVTFDPAAGPVGTYGGRLVATAGDTVVQTTIGGYKEPERHELTPKITDRDGRELPAGDTAGVAMVQSLDDPGVGEFPVFSGQPVRLPPGRYAVLSIVNTPVAGQFPSTTLVPVPEVTLDRDLTLSLDARKGNKVGLHVDKPDAAVESGISGMLVRTGVARSGFVAGWSDDLYAVPTTGSGDGFLYYNRLQAERPLVRLAVGGAEPFDVPVRWVPSSPEFHENRSYTAVDVGRARPEELAAHDLTGKLAVFTLTAAEAEEFDARVAAIARAGAAVALFRFSESMSVFADTPPIPAVYTMGGEGARLAALGTAPVTLSGIAFSPYRYELVFAHPGAVPATVDYRVRDRRLATVHARYHAMVPGGIGYLDYGTDAYGFDLGGNLWSATLPLPAERTEYYTPDPVTWDLSVRGAAKVGEGPEWHVQGPTVTYRAGSRQTVDWGSAVFGPSLAVDDRKYTGRPYLVAREGDTVRATLPLLSDAGRHSGYPAPEDYGFADKGDTSLYAGDVLVGSSGVPGAGVFTVPAGDATYRLVSSVTRSHPAWPVSTQVDAEWTFRSGHTAAATPLPLLTVGFAPPVDALNHAPAGRRIAIPVTVDRQTGATGGRATADSVEYSVDDGATWVKVKPRKKDGHWEVTVPNPAGGFVSLRASASDHHGNTVRQTVLRAYRVR